MTSPTVPTTAPILLTLRETCPDGTVRWCQAPIPHPQYGIDPSAVPSMVEENSRWHDPAWQGISYHVGSSANLDRVRVRILQARLSSAVQSLQMPRGSTVEQYVAQNPSVFEVVPCPGNNVLVDPDNVHYPAAGYSIGTSARYSTLSDALAAVLAGILAGEFQRERSVVGFMTSQHAAIRALPDYRIPCVSFYNGTRHNAMSVVSGVAVLQTLIQQADTREQYDTLVGVYLATQGLAVPAFQVAA